MPATRSSLHTPRHGLDRRSYPMTLWRKAKRLGTWDPAAIDFSRDEADWRSLGEDERDLLLRLTAQFQGGEESVALDLLPLLQAVAAEGRVEEEMFLTAYLWEEAKHVDGFDRFLREVVGVEGSLEHYLNEPYRRLFLHELPASLDRLRTDPTPPAQAEAAATYQMIVEGVLAETGYQAYYTVLETNDLLPGMRAFIRKVQRDEARHVAYGVFLLSRLVAEHGDAVWNAVERRMNDLLGLVVDQIQATLAPYDPAPFGIEPDDFIDIGLGQFQKRIRRIEAARTQTLDQVLYPGSGSADRSAAGTSQPATPPT
jgi:ribonucleoside-diphosphate reductase beta chain